MISRRVALWFPALCLAGCGSSPPLPPSLEVTIQAGLDQNPDAEGQSAAVAIRLYQLVADQAFARADVYALMERESATLDADNLGSDEVIIAPGEQRLYAPKLKNNARFVGAIALFRDIDNAAWRARAPIAPQGPTKLRLTTARLGITLT